MSGQFSLIRLFFPLIIVISIPLTIFLVFQNTDSRQRASEEAILYLVPDVGSTKSGQTISYTLAVDSQNKPMRSLQINLAYPAYKVDIAKIDTTDSPFDLPVEEISRNGIIRLGREATTPVYGVQHVATIQFLAKDIMEASEVLAVPGTEVRSLENTNIYKSALARKFPDENTSQQASFIESFLKALQNILP